MILALLLIPVHSGLSQGLIISPGASFIGTGGNIVLKGDMVNNGSLSNANNTIIFAGAAQSLGGTSPILFNNLTVASGSSTTILTTGQTLSGILLSNGTLYAGGNITLLSTATQTALIDGSGNGEVYGDVTMQRFLSSGFGYKYFSSPFQGATVNEFGDDMYLAASFPAFYKYDESRVSSGWVNYVNPAGVLNPLNGYAVNFGSDVAALTADVTGVVNNGNLSRTMYNNNRTYTKGFNLAGNPYPSPIDWKASSGWTKTNIDDALYFFSASNTDQYGGNYSTLIGGIPSDGLVSKIIPSMQGFFVHVKDDANPVTGVLSMNNNVRVTNQSQSFIKGDKGRSLLRFTASFSNNLGSPDYSVVYFDPKATSEFDGQLDALKLLNTDMGVPNVYSVTPEGTTISIKALPYAIDTSYIVPLGLIIYQAGDVIFRICAIEGTFSEMRTSLFDKVTGKVQDLLNNQEYKISLNAGEFKNRFFLNMSNVITENPDSFPGPDLFNIYYSQGILHAEINNIQGAYGTLMICNLLGQTLFIQRLYEEGYHEFSTNLKDGIYIAVFISGTKRSSKKIFIPNQ